MNLLAIDTSSNACSVALLHNNVMKTVHEHAPMLQAQNILPCIDRLLKTENFSINQLDAIAFGCGPGSFTGIRIATSIAQGLGYALAIPLIPISSLAALAQAAFTDSGWRNLFVAIDARIQEIYCGYYQVNSNDLVELQGREIVCSPQSIPDVEPKILEYYGVGNAWETYSDQIKIKPTKINANYIPTASAIIQLAIPLYKNNQWVEASQALPVYLRDNVATKQKKR